MTDDAASHATFAAGCRTLSKIRRTELPKKKEVEARAECKCLERIPARLSNAGLVMATGRRI